MNVFTTDRLNTSLLLFLLQNYTFDVDLMEFLEVYTSNHFEEESVASYVISIQRSYSRKSYKNKP